MLTTSSGNLTGSAEFLSTLLEQVVQPFVVVEGGGKILHWNHAFQALSGYSTADLRKTPLIALFSAKSRIPERIEALIEGEPAEPVITELQTSEKELVPVEIRCCRLDSPDGGPLVLIQAENLSVRQHLEAQLRQSQKMEAVGKLAGGIAHDFNNVLTTILGLTESMMSGRTAPSSESLREIHHAASHAAELTNSLLAFSRRQILQMRNIRLDAVVENIAKMVSRLIGEHINLEIAVAVDLPPVRADQSQIEQVLLNLCLNARDAMPKGGELRIDARTETVGHEWLKQNQGAKPGTYVVLSVRDSGEGMDEATLRRIFEPFFTRKAPGKGTGLGLSMVYGIVKQHAGYIHVTSNIGKGTEFNIYFPPCTGEAVAAAPVETVVSEKGTATVLVVEDEKSVRRLILEVLSGLGYRVFAAADGVEAVKIFERWADKIDLVFLDAVLPKKSSREVFDEIRRRKPAVRFLFTSGYNEVFINQSFELDPSFDFLRKPFTTSELVTRIRKALA